MCAAYEHHYHQPFTWPNYGHSVPPISPSLQSSPSNSNYLPYPGTTTPSSYTNNNASTPAPSSNYQLPYDFQNFQANYFHQNSVYPNHHPHLSPYSSVLGSSSGGGHETNNNPLETCGFTVPINSSSLHRHQGMPPLSIYIRTKYCMEFPFYNTLK